jgi:hypothetical protein
MDNATAILAAKAGIAAYREGSSILVTLAFEDIDPRTLATINKHADAVAANLVSGPEVLPCGNCGGGGGTWEEVTYFQNGQLYGDNGLPDGSWVSYSSQTYYYSNYMPTAGASPSPNIYYNNPPQPKLTTCGLTVTAATGAAIGACKYIQANPGVFSQVGKAFAVAGMSAVGVASAYLTAGTATVAGAVAFAVELAGMLTVGGWLVLIGAVAGLAALAIQSYQCLHGE